MVHFFFFHPFWVWAPPGLCPPPGGIELRCGPWGPPGSGAGFLFVFAPFWKPRPLWLVCKSGLVPGVSPWETGSGEPKCVAPGAPFKEGVSPKRLLCSQGLLFGEKECVGPPRKGFRVFEEAPGGETSCGKCGGARVIKYRVSCFFF